MFIGGEGNVDRGGRKVGGQRSEKRDVCNERVLEMEEVREGE